MSKLHLKSLKLQSFVTEMSAKTGQTIKGKGGGTYLYDCDYHPKCGGSDSCYPIYTDKCPTVDCTRKNC